MQVFFSYDVADQAFAERLRSSLRSAGLQVWDPHREVIPGENWATKIGEALESSNAMIVILSPKSMDSAAVRREIEYALGAPNFKGRLVPVITRRTTRVPWILKTLPAVGPVRDFKSASDRIVKLLRSRVTKTHSKSRPLKTRRNAATSKTATAD